MKFDLGATVGGRPLDAARDLLRSVESYTANRVADRLGMAEGEAEHYLQALVDAGYLTRMDFPASWPIATYEATGLGISLRKSTKAKRMSRGMAEGAVNALLKEAERINADPTLISWVDELDIFGSYLSDAADLGDVDVAVRLGRRLPSEQWIAAGLERAGQAGSRHDFATRAFWGDFEVWRMLKASSRRLDLQPKNDIVGLGVSLRPIYRRTVGSPP